MDLVGLDLLGFYGLPGSLDHEADRRGLAVASLKWWKNHWRRRVHERWYGFKCRWLKKYNRLHIRTLPPTWTDRSDMLPHAMFQILTDFIDKEKPFEYFDTEDKYHRNEWQELKGLYDWWHSVYLKFDPMEGYDTDKATPRDELFAPTEDGMYTMRCNEYDTEFFMRVRLADDEMEKVLGEKMSRLCALRGMLWT